MNLGGRSGNQRRRHVRRPVDLPARVRIGDGDVAAMAENISPGGAFLRVDLPADAARLVASIDLPHGKRVHVEARIRWRRLAPPGVGVQFETFLDER
jgi:PilZ domain